MTLALTEGHSGGRGGLRLTIEPNEASAAKNERAPSCGSELSVPLILGVIHMDNRQHLESAMEQQITLALSRTDAEILLRSLKRRSERLCDIRQELCGPEPSDELEREEAAFFEEENAVVERAIEALRNVLEPLPNNSGEWSGQELEELKRLAADRMPAGEISEKLGRTESSVKYKAGDRNISLKQMPKSPAS
ncbi:hypothetical protein [Methylocystis sp. S23]|jgi:hypothetical protein